MAIKKQGLDEFALTDLQERFVEYFIGECEFNAVEAYRRAGYKKDSYLYSAAMKVLDSPAVKRAIHERLNESTFWLNEQAVIERLWKEALTANAASARINALVWVGKHLGMWREKQEENNTSVTYNVINYGVDEKEVRQTIENTPEVELAKDKVKLPEGVQVLTYNKLNDEN